MEHTQESMLFTVKFSTFLFLLSPSSPSLFPGQLHQPYIYHLIHFRYKCFHEWNSLNTPSNQQHYPSQSIQYFDRSELTFTVQCLQRLKLFSLRENILPPQVTTEDFFFLLQKQFLTYHISYLKLTSFQTRNFRRYSIAEEFTFTIHKCDASQYVISFDVFTSNSQLLTGGKYLLSPQHLQYVYFFTPTWVNFRDHSNILYMARMTTLVLPNGHRKNYQNATKKYKRKV